MTPSAALPTAWVDEVVSFWFGTLTPKAWWTADPAIDAEIARRFGDLRSALANAPPDPATLDARGHLAAVLVLDQFPRNLFRGAAQAFATDAAARAVCLAAVDRALDAALPVCQRHFVYMPLMHAEDPALQRRSLALFERLGEPDALRSARAHHDTIVRFGRFPYRNVALGRTSTPGEQAFLAEHAAPS